MVSAKRHGLLYHIWFHNWEFKAHDYRLCFSVVPGELIWMSKCEKKDELSLLQDKEAL